MTLEDILSDVAAERTDQDAKWGEQNIDGFVWLSILAEALGEAAQATLHDHFGGKHTGTLRQELIQAEAEEEYEQMSLC